MNVSDSPIRSVPTEEASETEIEQSHVAARPTISSHGDLRWVQRGHEFECRPQRAWRRARPAEINGREFDQVRYDGKTDTLLCVTGGVLTTVLRANYEEFRLTDANRQRRTQRVCARCGHSRTGDPDECPQCGSRIVLDQDADVSVQEGR